jgi:hypothetical protein
MGGAPHFLAATVQAYRELSVYPVPGAIPPATLPKLGWVYDIAKGELSAQFKELVAG